MSITCVQHLKKIRISPSHCTPVINIICLKVVPCIAKYWLCKKNKIILLLYCCGNHIYINIQQLRRIINLKIFQSYCKLGINGVCVQVILLLSQLNTEWFFGKYLVPISLLGLIKWNHTFLNLITLSSVSKILKIVWI